MKLKKRKRKINMVNNNDYQLGSIVTLKKPHPSKTIEWKIIRIGADIKIKSTIKKGLFIMMTRSSFNRKVNKIIKK